MRGDRTSGPARDRPARISSASRHAAPIATSPLTWATATALVPTAKTARSGAASATVSPARRSARSGMRQAAQLQRKRTQTTPTSRDAHVSALDEYIAVFGRFWQSDRLVLRRRTGLGVLARRILTQVGQPEGQMLDEIVNALSALTSFEFFDTLAGPARSLEEVAPLVSQIARAALESMRQALSPEPPQNADSTEMTGKTGN